MARPYVAVIGSVCGGKTTFVNRFAENHSDWLIQPEQVDSNPYIHLVDQASDMVFRSTMWFMGYYAQRHLIAAHTDGMVMQETCLQTSSLFPGAFFELGFLSLDDLNTFKLSYATLVDCLPEPDLFIYLSAPLEILLERAKHREGPNSFISQALIPVIQPKLDSWIQNEVDPDNVFKIDTRASNLLQDAGIFGEVYDWIQKWH